MLRFQKTIGSLFADTSKKTKQFSLDHSSSWIKHWLERFVQMTIVSRHWLSSKIGALADITISIHHEAKNLLSNRQNRHSRREGF